MRKDGRCGGVGRKGLRIKDVLGLKTKTMETETVIKASAVAQKSVFRSRNSHLSVEIKRTRHVEGRMKEKTLASGKLSHAVMDHGLKAQKYF